MRWLAVTLGLILVEGTAAAAPCTVDQVAAEITALGGPNLGDIAAHVEIDGRTGSVTYVMASGELVGPRTVKAASCAELAKSLALVIVMSWRADEEARAIATPAPPPVPATPLRPLAPPRSDEAIEPPIATAARAPHEGDRHVAAVLGVASGVDDQPALVLGARWRRGRISLGGELHASAPLTLDVGDGGSVTVSRYGVDAVPCVHVSRFALCGLARAGVIGGEGQQLAHAATVWRTALAAGARVEASYPLWRTLAIRVHVDGLQALTSARFSVDEMVVWTSKPRELWLGGGLTAVFP